MQEFFITATGTDLGKTLLVSKLIAKLKSLNCKIDAIKPIASGYHIDDHNSDSYKIYQQLYNDEKNEERQEKLNKITPWHFKEPVSPHFAAKINNQNLEFELINRFCQERIKLARKEQSYLLIEGAGGIMTPINYQYSFLDLAIKLNINNIILIGNYLGSISHSLTAINSIINSGLKIHTIIINDFRPNITNYSDSQINNEELIATIKSFYNLPMFPDITSFCEDFANKIIKSPTNIIFSDN
jgi:dethiobiotin synthetase